MRKHGIDAAASATAVSEPSASTHPLQQLPAGAVASLRDPDLGPPDADTLLAAVAPVPPVLGNTLTAEDAAAAREALRAGVLGDYAREVDDLRAWHTDPADTAFGRARLRALRGGGAR